MKKFFSDLTEKHSKRELIMLAALLLFVAYYLAVQLPVSKIGAKIDEEQTTVDQKIVAAEEKLTLLPVMMQQLQMYKTNEAEHITPAADNTKGVLDGYHEIIGEVQNYNIQFNGSDKQGKVTRKYMELSFTVNSYTDAVNKIEALENNRNGFLLGNTTITSAQVGENATTTVWNVSTTITEFEYNM